MTTSVTTSELLACSDTSFENLLLSLDGIVKYSSYQLSGAKDKEKEKEKGKELDKSKEKEKEKEREKEREREKEKEKEKLELQGTIQVTAKILNLINDNKTIHEVSFLSHSFSLFVCVCVCVCFSLLHMRDSQSSIRSRPSIRT